MADEILIITNADMSLQSGDVALLNRRSLEFYKKFNMKTTCMLTNNVSNINYNNEGIDKYIKNISKKDILNYIISYKPKIIILYGTESWFYIWYLKKIIKKFNLNIELLIDMQGALEESIEYPSNNILTANFKFLIKRRIFKIALNNVDGAFVVSDELGKYCNAYLDSRRIGKFKSYKVRCGVNEIIASKQKMLWRNEIRESWKIDDNTVVMAYSGYRMPWQNVDKIIELFKEYDQKMDKVFFSFFCNIDEKFEEEIEKSFPKGNYELKFLKSDEYFKYLCACDVGILVRDHNMTNEVAFPNKFSEYLNAGLMVALNNALPEPYRILENYDIKFIDIRDKSEHSIEKVKERQNNISEYYKKTENICKEELLYSEQIIKIGRDMHLNHTTE